jgi:hypothetical protein
VVHVDHRDRPERIGDGGRSAELDLRLQDEEGEADDGRDGREPGQPAPSPGWQVPIGEQEEEEGGEPGREQEPGQRIVSPGHPRHERERTEPRAPENVLGDHAAGRPEEGHPQEDPARRVPRLPGREQSADDAEADREDHVDRVRLGNGAYRGPVRDQQGACRQPCQQHQGCQGPGETGEPAVLDVALFHRSHDCLAPGSGQHGWRPVNRWGVQHTPHPSRYRRGRAAQEQAAQEQAAQEQAGLPTGGSAVGRERREPRRA